MIEQFLCECTKSYNGNKNEIVEHFTKLRGKCPAINEILIPDCIFDQYINFVSKPLDQANHQSILLLAFQRNYLHKITIPIHKYLINKNINENYKKDLQEFWLKKGDILDRHKTARIYMGKLYEILIADWLDYNNWEIIELEATGGIADIVAISQNKVKHFFELKFIGVEDEVFWSIVNSMQDHSSCSNFSSYSACDFLLYKAFTAAKQLENFYQNTIVIITISNISWDFFDIQLKEDWINWTNPTFFNNDSKWITFFAEQKKKYPNIENEIGSTINKLSELWIVEECDNFEFKLAKRITLST